jgi:hypothetical protein
VPLGVHRDDGQETRREYVLALRQMRRGVERRASAALGTRPMTATNTELARALRELIDALDRRVPRVAHVGEVTIARDAKVLRDKAVKRLEELALDDAAALRTAALHD